MPYFICFTFTRAAHSEGPIFASCFYLDNDKRNETFDRRMVPVARRWKRGAPKPACDCLHSHLFRVHKTLLSLPPANVYFFFFLTPSRPMTREMTPKKIPRKEKREREKRCLGKAATRKGKDRTGTPIHSQTHKRTHTHTEPVLFLGTGTYLKKLSQDGNTIPMFFSLTIHVTRHVRLNCDW